MWTLSVNPAADCKQKFLCNNLPACHRLSLVLLCNMLSRIHKQRTRSLCSRLQIKSSFIWIPNLQSFEMQSQYCKPKYSYKRSFHIIPCSIIQSFANQFIFLAFFVCSSFTYWVMNKRIIKRLGTFLKKCCVYY